MEKNLDASIPAGVRATAGLFAACSFYLAIIGILMIARPGAVSMSTGAPLLFGLELAGPYMFLLMAFAGAAVAFGLLKLNNITRHIALLIAITGVVMLVPEVSAATVMVNAKELIYGGFGIIVRIMIAWYLSQGTVAERFHRVK